MKLIYSIISFLLTSTPVYAAERENFYSDKICAELYSGEVVRLESGLFPDCMTEFVVIEFDWAKSPKHYECIGQALIYAQQTGKHPVCVLLARSDDELVFGKSLVFEPFGITTRVIDTRLWDQ